eukprot:TRINITY_DN3925_c0_g1_i3.p2 TRINITY_DN3925_c0_g1~~TRINITY_DN3925_c0_g1_i3.p2  ORF type:complete len:110 (+),score=20.28 TRINITY_DN3925_c0_g1_i3:278-607(+)
MKHKTFFQNRTLEDEEQKAGTETTECTLVKNKNKLAPSYDFSRTNSAPLEFDASNLFSYLEDDFFTKSFSKPHSSGARNFPAPPAESFHNFALHYRPVHMASVRPASNV